MFSRPALTFRYVFSALVLIASIYLLVIQLGDLPFSAAVFQPTQPLLIVLALALMPLNWWMESKKWADLTGLSTLESTRGVLAGVAVGLFTINRLGDGVGKYFFKEKLDKLQFGKAFIAGSLAQLGATLLFGIIAIAYLPFEDLLWLQDLASGGLGKTWLITCLAFVFLIAAYFKMKKVHYWPTLGFWRPAIAWSLLRYLVFSFQYLLLLYAFDVSLSVFMLWACIAVIYLVNTLFPSTILGELGVREAASLLIIGSFTEAGWEVAGAGLLIWIINLLLPGLLGGYLLWGKWNDNKTAA